MIHGNHPVVESELITPIPDIPCVTASIPRGVSVVGEPLAPGVGASCSAQPTWMNLEPGPLMAPYYRPQMQLATSGWNAGGQGTGSSAPQQESGAPDGSLGPPKV